MRVEAELSPTALRISTTLEGEAPVAFGWHPWIAPPGAARADFHVELPAMMRIELDDRHLPTGGEHHVDAHAGPLPERELDDAFEAVPDGARFAVTGGGRRIELRLESGYPCAQVFAPPGKDLICFEPMTAPANALRSGAFAVGPHTAVFEVAVDTV
jgi:galactose mutarotase-like enzyme